MSKREVMVKFIVPDELTDKEFGELLILQLGDSKSKFCLSSGRWVNSLSAEEYEEKK